MSFKLNKLLALVGVTLTLVGCGAADESASQKQDEAKNSSASALHENESTQDWPRLDPRHPGRPGRPGHPGWPGQPGPVQPYPGYPQPGYPQPGYPQPGYPQPGYPQPGYPQPGYPQPGYPQPGYPQPGYPQPGYPQQNGVTVYNGYGLTGGSQFFPVGEYYADRGHIQVGNDSIASLNIPYGFSVRLCQDEGFFGGGSGHCQTFGPGRIVDVGPHLQRQISYVEVKRN